MPAYFDAFSHDCSSLTTEGGSSMSSSDIFLGFSIALNIFFLSANFDRKFKPMHHTVVIRIRTTTPPKADQGLRGLAWHWDWNSRLSFGDWWQHHRCSSTASLSLQCCPQSQMQASYLPHQPAYRQTRSIASRQAPGFQ